MNEDEKRFEVVFFSGDGSKENFDKYYEEMPWPAIPWKDRRIKVVAKEFKVKGLPQLIVLKRDGTLINNNAVQKITDEGPEAIEEWLK
jgi:nucleoredoxin